MRLTEKEKESARNGCHFYYNGYCMNDIKGKTWCVCLQTARDKKKKNPKSLASFTEQEQKELPI